MAVDTSNFRNGLKIELDGEPFVMIYFQHVKPGKGGAFVRTKVKNLRNGRVLDKTFRSGEKVTEAEVEEKKMQYLYQDGSSYIFMDGETFDQLPFAAPSALRASPVFSRRSASLPGRRKLSANFSQKISTRF